MQKIEIFPMNEQHEHVESLPANLETNFNPVHFSELEEFCTGKSF
jgi:hypothetical protein